MGFYLFLKHINNQITLDNSRLKKLMHSKDIMIRTIGSAFEECVTKLMLKSNTQKNSENYSIKTNLANLAATGVCLKGVQ